MAGDSAKKLFVGPRFRRIRQQLGLSQTQMAEGLEISPSYINLIERNQRPVTAQLLLRLAETYDLDLRDLATADEDRFFAELNEIFSDPLFRQIDLPKQELRDLAELCPGVTHSLQRLYAAYTEARRGETMVAAQMADRDEGTRYEANPIERIRDLIEANRNYFPELEQSAESLRDELNVPVEELFAALAARLREKHSVVTRIMPVDVMRETLRRFDRHRRQLLISELVDGPGRAFQLAFQIGLAECSGSFDAIVNRAGPLDDTPRRLYRITLANYFAAAVMMPYQAFHGAAEALNYDVHVLAQRFNAGFEQVCHRLTTLQRPNARGVPFFLLRFPPRDATASRTGEGLVQRAVCLGVETPHPALRATFSHKGRRKERACASVAVFGKFLVDPAAAVVTAPDLAGQQATSDRAPRNDHVPQVPDLGPCRFWAQAQYSKSLPAFSEHGGFRQASRQANRMRDGLVICRRIENLRPLPR